MSANLKVIDSDKHLIDLDTKFACVCKLHEWQSRVDSPIWDIADENPRSVSATWDEIDASCLSRYNKVIKPVWNRDGNVISHPHERVPKLPKLTSINLKSPSVIRKIGDICEVALDLLSQIVLRFLKIVGPVKLTHRVQEHPVLTRSS